MRKIVWLLTLLVISLVLVSCAFVAQNDGAENNGNQPTVGNNNNATNDNETDVNEPDNDFVYQSDNIEKFKLEIELLNDHEIDYKYERDDDQAQIDRDDTSSYLTDEDAKEQLLELMNTIEINLDKSLEEMIHEVLSHLGVLFEELDEFKLEVEFHNSKKISFKYDREELTVNKTIKEFNLEIDFWDDTEYDIEYELDDDYEITGRETLEKMRQKLVSKR